MNRNKLSNIELDAEIERGIQEFLAMEPSREFVAAVRTRVASELAPSEWRLGRTFMLAGAMTAALVVGVVFTRLIPPSRDQQPPLTGSVGSALPAPVPAAETRERATASRPAAKVSHATVRRHQPGPVLVSNRSGEPEVLVSPGEAAALRRWLMDISAGRVELSTAHLPTTIEEVSELTGIHPLVPVTIQEGVLQ
jgi:hypothetical protein